MASLERKEREEECDLDLDEIRFFFPMSALQFLVQIAFFRSYRWPVHPRFFLFLMLKNGNLDANDFMIFFIQNIFLLVHVFCCNAALRTTRESPYVRLYVCMYVRLF